MDDPSRARKLGRADGGADGEVCEVSSFGRPTCRRSTEHTDCSLCHVRLLSTGRAAFRLSTDDWTGQAMLYAMVVVGDQRNLVRGPVSRSFVRPSRRSARGPANAHHVCAPVEKAQGSPPEPTRADDERPAARVQVAVGQCAHREGRKVSPSSAHPSLPPSLIREWAGACDPLTDPLGSHPKRLLATDFKVLPDRQEWADYYKVITEPRCLNEIQVRPPPSSSLPLSLGDRLIPLGRHP